MAAETLVAERFVRRTGLRPDEYRKNFRQLDGEVIATLTSVEADAVTPLMSKIYLRLANAPGGHWEREGVLRFAGEESYGRWVTAWEQLVALSGVSSATARKALRWMHEQGVVGYFAGKNGVGIRIFLNRAVSSIGRRPEPVQKNLRLVHASTRAPRASAGDTPFNDSYADSEVLETDLIRHAPKNGADDARVGKTSPLHPPRPNTFQTATPQKTHGTSDPLAVGNLNESLLNRLEPMVRAAAAQAAAREHERTREWLESRGLPKAARVAQHETYNVLKRYGVIDEITRRKSEVGRNDCPPSDPRPLSDEEVLELAEAAVAVLETQGRPVDATLAQMNAAAGGFLLPEDSARVRARVNSLLSKPDSTN